MVRKIKFNHSKLLPNVLMGIISGKTNAGKTHLLFYMLTTPGILDYERLIILTTTPEQKYYQFLKHGFNNKLDKLTIQKSFELYEDSDEDLNIESLCYEASTLLNEEVNSPKIEIILTNNPSIIEDPVKLKDKKNLIIFDDYMTQKDQSIPEMMYTRGRHNNCACIYLAQNFYQINTTIRKNASLIILFKADKRSLTDLMRNITVSDENEFKQYAKNIWTKENGYVVINLINDLYFTKEDLFCL